MSDMPPRPKPRPGPESLPYWQAAREHQLALPKCDACEKFWFPPSASCPHCLSSQFSFSPVSGLGKVFSHVTFHRVYRAAFTERVPYVVALVELEEGPRLLTNIVGMQAEDVRCDMPVQVCFEDIDADASIPQFKPRESC